MNLIRQPNKLWHNASGVVSGQFFTGDISDSRREVTWHEYQRGVRPAGGAIVRHISSLRWLITQDMTSVRGEP